jgi:hypothetical protein
MAFFPTGGLAQAMGGGQGISAALQGASPLLLAMSAGLGSGQGLMSQAPAGMLLMQQQQKQKQEQAAKDAAAGAYGSWQGGTMASGLPAALGASNTPPPPTGPLAGAMRAPAPAAAASGGNPGLVFEEFKKHGVPDHIAYGALGNFKQESGFNPTAFNEGEGAFGMGQWRGDRLENLKRFADANGTDPSDPRTQVAFTVHEWQTTERGAWDKIAQSRDPAEAAAAIDQHYERSSGEHREARVKNAVDYAQGWQGTFGETQVADPANDPQVQGMIGWLAQHGEADPSRAAAVKMQLEMRIQQLQAQSEGQGLTDAQAAQFGLQEAGQQPGPLTPDQRYQNVQGVGLVDLYAEGGPKPVLTGPVDPMSSAGKLKADLDAGRITQDQFDAEMSRGNLAFSTDAEGNTTFAMGSGGQRLKPLTEGQSKDNFYLTAVQHAKDVDKYEKAMTGVGAAGNAVAGALPGGGFLQSEEYQVGQVAAKEWGAAILRKESGAALTASDMEWLTSRFIPVPTDKPGTVARKRAARKAAEAGLKSGMTDEQIRSVADSLAAATGEDAPASPAAPGPVRVKTVLEANDLPSGTVFIDPNGVRRVKP